MTRLLKILFVILVVITIGELGYYLYIQSTNKKISPRQSVENLATAENKDTTTIEPDKSPVSWCSDAMETDAEGKVFILKAVEIDAQRRKGLVKDARINVVYKGIVANKLQMIKSTKIEDGADSSFVYLQIVNPSKGEKDYAIASPKDILVKTPLQFQKGSDSNYTDIALADLEKYIKIDNSIEVEISIRMGVSEPEYYKITLLD